MWVLFPYHLRNLQIYVIPEKKNKMARRLIKVTIVPRNVNSSLKGKLLSTAYMKGLQIGIFHTFNMAAIFFTFYLSMFEQFSFLSLLFHTWNIYFFWEATTDPYTHALSKL